jgi:hypothetical protein
VLGRSSAASRRRSWPIGAGTDWWDGERWDRELADDLLPVAHSIADDLGKAEAKRLGFAEGYDGDRTVDFLKAVAAGTRRRSTRRPRASSTPRSTTTTDPADVFDGSPRTSRGRGRCRLDHVRRLVRRSRPPSRSPTTTA